MQDNNGRPYTLVSEVRVGSILEADSEFACMRPHSQHEVLFDGIYQYIECDEGFHALDGQIQYSGDTEFYIGLYLVK